MARAMTAHPENEIVLEDEVGEAGHEDEDGWEHKAPQEYDAVRLWQLHQIGDLEAGDVINGKQRCQSLHGTIDKA